LRREVSLCWPDPAVELTKRFKDDIIERKEIRRRK
jgi:hypothetical protein